ncbi:WD domain, G-beta repeat protein (macronuclear) [Tetrahymena thermophila SB210]|uniref:WD domain, G-beta repeat protein n=1 Tax=Tetrahymena thermophila (strain SB210) TaxID=312017 RepID=I7LVA9_TETTS|nr:WD domain, G-beta repeat protein [Tetrahymena thermophila SB210]EAR97578.2 WD domain, G-beta repeat protein [Tetrahymena thermophila SB210]|eukprot:XP_001017823.2 WD domain, G-beta repeat protein [Tetrahymena thermophila SB210]
MGHRLLGGGCGASKQQDIVEKKTQEVQNDYIGFESLDQNFIENFNQSQDQKEIVKNIIENKQLESQYKLFKQSIFDFSSIIVSNINLYKPYVFELLETYLAYFITQCKQNDDDDSKNICAELSKMISEFKNQLEKKTSDSPCQDVLYMIEILEQYNNQSDSTKSNPDLDFYEDVKKFVVIIISLKPNDKQQQLDYNQSQINQIILQINNKIHKFEDSPQGCIIKYLLQVWILKIEKFKEKMWEISNTEEFLLYIQPFQNQFNTFLKNLNLNQQDKVIFNKEYILLNLQNICFKQLSTNIQLRLKYMLDQTNMLITDNNQLFLGLICQYLFENTPQAEQTYSKQVSNVVVKQVFECNSYFMSCYQQIIKDQQFMNKIIQFDGERKKYVSFIIENLDQYEIKISNIEEIQKLIFQNSISKWQTDLKIKLKQTQSQISKKQLQIKQMYANQQFQILEGNNFFNDIQSIDVINENRIQQILIGLLNQSKDRSVLVVSGETGYGKTRLLHEIKSILTNNLNIFASYQSYPNYIPIFIQCELLKKYNNSLDLYLLDEGLNKNQISYLKESENLKLFIFDNFEDCIRAYQNINQILSISQWKNTKWLLSIRKDKLKEYNITNLIQTKCQPSNISLIELKKLKSQTTMDYLNQVIKISTLDSNEFKINLQNKIQQIQQNLNLRKLIKIPINLFYISKLIKNQNISLENIRFQSDIFELFYQKLFEKQSVKFINQEIHQQTSKKDANIKLQIINSYFEYYQHIALLAFLSRDQQSLEVEKQKVKFTFSEQIKKLLNSNIRDKLLQTIEKQNNQILLNNQEQHLSIKNLCLYHYFVARAIKFDFQSHESIYKLSISQLKEFSINKKLFVYHKLSNNQDYGIMQTFFHLIQPEIMSKNFMSSYESDNVSEMNKYLQYIKMSKIKKSTDFSEIDIGASNLLSALFMSNFFYFNLNLSFCSFSSSYISQAKHHSVNLDRSNLSQAFIKDSNLNLASSNTQYAYHDNLPKIFDTNNYFNFNQICFSESNLIYSTTNDGFLNIFEYNNLQFQLKQSKYITSSPLTKLLMRKNYLIMSSLNVLFVIDKQNLEIQNILKFSESIKDFSFSNSKSNNCIISLVNNQSFSGDITTSKVSLLNIQTQYLAISNNNKYLATSMQESILIYNLENQLNMITTIKDQHFDPISSIAFSNDSKYLATGSLDLSCKVWDVEKNFQFITSIEDCKSKIIQVIFSNDNKYLFILSFDKYCRIYTVKDNFKLVSTIQVNMKLNAFISFSSDDKQIGICNDDNICHIYNNDENFSLLTTIKCHRNQINSIKFSSNNKFMISNSSDSSKLWNVENNFKGQFKIPEIQQAILYQISYDSAYLAAVFHNKSVKIWNMEKGFSLSKTLSQLNDEIVDIQFSFNNKYLCIQLKQDKISLYSIQKNFELLYQFQEPFEQLSNVYFSHNSQNLILLNNKSKFLLYNSDEGFKKKIQFEFEQADNVANSFDCQYFAFSYNNICKIFSIDKEVQQICSLQKHTKNISFMTFSKDNLYFATASLESLENQIYFWSVKQNFSLIFQLTPQSKSLSMMQFSSDSQYFITVGRDQICVIWDIYKGYSTPLILNLNSNQICSAIDITCDQRYLALASSSNIVCYNLQGIQLPINDQQVVNNKGHTHSINFVSYSHDGNYLATGSWDKSFKIWEAKQGFELVKTIKQHTDPISCLDFSKDGKFLISASVDKTCKIWDPKDNFKLKATIKNPDSIQSVVFSCDSKYLALSSWDDTVRVYDVLNEFQLLKELQNHSKQVNSVQFSSDGKYLVSTSDDKTIKIYDLQKDFQLLQNINAHTRAVTAAKFSQNNTDLASVSKDQTCKIWDVQNKFQLKATLKGHTEQVSQCVYSPDDCFLLTCSWDNTCRIWSKSQNYQLINLIKAHSSPITSITFSPDQQYLITSSVDNKAKVWSTNKAFKIIKQICSLGDFNNAIGQVSQNKKYFLIKQVNQDWYVISFTEGNVVAQGKQYLDEVTLSKYQLDQIQLEDITNLQLFDYSFEL